MADYDLIRRTDGIEFLERLDRRLADTITDRGRTEGVTSLPVVSNDQPDAHI
jgi:hypothetical protein